MIKLSILTPVWNQEDLVIKGLESIPRRDDIEVIVRDDGSTDNTLANLRKYKEEHPELRMRVYSNGKNLGVAATANKLIASAKGEFFHFLMSDDYLLTDKYSKMVDSLYETQADVVCINLIENSGLEYDLNETNGNFYCAQACRFIRREFISGIKYPEKVKCGEDGFFHADMMARNPKVEYSHCPVYRYNYPREGSLVNLRLRGLIRDEDLRP